MYQSLKDIEDEDMDIFAKHLRELPFCPDPGPPWCFWVGEQTSFLLFETQTQVSIQLDEIHYESSQWVFAEFWGG